MESAARTWREQRPLATGGMAELSLVETDDGTLGVLKRIRSPLTKDPSYRALFDSETRLSAALDHPHIPRLLDRGVDDDGPYLILEYIAGTDFARVLDGAIAAGEGVDPACVAAAMSAALDALSYAHERALDDDGAPLGVVHRDLSPENLLLGQTGRVVLIDFGVADSRVKSHQTQVGELKGKYAYMSPEQTRGEPLGPTSDLFSLGIVAWELLAGARLFDGPTDADTVRLVRERAAPNLTERAPLVPDELAALVGRLLAKDPADRPPSAAEAARALDEIRDAHFLRQGCTGKLARLARARPSDLAADPSGAAQGRRRTQRVIGAGPSTTDAPASPARGRAPTGVSLAALAGVGLAAALAAVLAFLPVGPLAAARREAAREPPSVDVDDTDRASAPAGPRPPIARVAPANASAPPATAPASTGPNATPAVGGDAPRPRAMRAGPDDGSRGDEPDGVASRADDAVPVDERRAAVDTGPRKTALSPASARPAQPAPRPLAADRARPRRPTRSSPRASSTPSPDADAPRSVGFGRLFLSSEPWAEVYVDGAKLPRPTPLVGVPLPAGDHVLELHNPHFGLRQRLRITLPKDGEVRRFVELR